LSSAADVSVRLDERAMGEAVAHYLPAVSIRTRARGMERATFMEAWRAKKREAMLPASAGLTS
jgi:hypothetical protein